jgi:hypothetical protein
MPDLYKLIDNLPARIRVVVKTKRLNIFLWKKHKPHNEKLTILNIYQAGLGCRHGAIENSVFRLKKVDKPIKLQYIIAKTEYNKKASVMFRKVI